MNSKNFVFLRHSILTAFSLGLIACDSADITNSSSELVAAAALQQPSRNLLDNGSFESQIGSDWRICSSISNFSNDAAPSNGNRALSISGGTCLSQTAPAEPGAAYTLRCDASTTNSGFSSITVGFIDDNSDPLETHENAITSTDYTTISRTITAPAQAISADVLIFSEGEATIDNCSLIRLPHPELVNGDFSDDLTGWRVCQDTTGQVAFTSDPLGDANQQLSVSNGGCVNQTIDISEVVASRSDFFSINLSCDTETDNNGYASISLGYRDASFEPIGIDVENVLSGTTNGVFASNLPVPFDTKFAEVTIFSNAVTTVDNCSLSF